MSQYFINKFAVPATVVSIVSHGHGAMVQRLLLQLAAQSATRISRVVVTHNIPEPSLIAPAQGWPFVVETISNAIPLGFGENHNNALQEATECCVCILNPDVELVAENDPFSVLIDAISSDAVGGTYPIQIDEFGQKQDSERELPSPWALCRRRLMKFSQRRVDWVNAACIVVPTSKWQAVGGFDTRYFMYCEDVDLSLRLQLMGWSLIRANATVIHRGQRASSKHGRHLVWHLQSLLRLWTSSAFWQYCFRTKK